MFCYLLSVRQSILATSSAGTGCCLYLSWQQIAQRRCPTVSSIESRNSTNDYQSIPTAARRIKRLNTTSQHASPPLARFSLSDVAGLEQSTDPMSTSCWLDRSCRSKPFPQLMSLPLIPSNLGIFLTAHPCGNRRSVSEGSGRIHGRLDSLPNTICIQEDKPDNARGMIKSMKFMLVPVHSDRTHHIPQMLSPTRIKTSLND